MKNKFISSLADALRACGLADGMTLSFHHHLRNGDHVVNMTMEAVAALGVKNITVACSSLFPVHKPLVEHIKSGVVTGIDTDYMSGPVAQAVAEGLLPTPVMSADCAAQGLSPGGCADILAVSVFLLLLRRHGVR